MTTYLREKSSPVGSSSQRVSIIVGNIVGSGLYQALNNHGTSLKLRPCNFWKSKENIRFTTEFMTKYEGTYSAFLCQDLQAICNFLSKYGSASLKHNRLSCTCMIYFYFYDNEHALVITRKHFIKFICTNTVSNCICEALMKLLHASWTQLVTHQRTQWNISQLRTYLEFVFAASRAT